MNAVGWSVVGAILLIGGGLAALRTPAVPSSSPVDRPATATVKRVAMIVPVAGVRPDELVDSWHDPREGGARVHEALDIAAPRGTPVIAAMAGRVAKLFQSARGGTTLYVRSGEWMAYYAHLAAYAPGLHEGQQVAQGAVLGFVGDTGDAGAGNTHLHFALARMRAGDGWWQGEPVNPYPLLATKPQMP